MEKAIQYVVMVAGFISALGVIAAAVSRVTKRVMRPMAEALRKMDIRECRIYLVSFLDRVEQNEAMNEVQYKLAYEVYDHYTNDLHENSYIHDRWQAVMNNGRK